MRGVQTAAGHLFCKIWASNSGRKYLKAERTGLGAVFPNPQREVSATTSANSSRSARLCSSPFPSLILSKIPPILFNPSRQGRHFPQDSSCKKWTKYFATSTIQVPSSMTIIPPEPIMDPACVRLSKSTGRLKSEAGIQPPEGPPVCTALIFLPSCWPPPISKMISLSVMPMATSTRPVFFTFPTREKILVPLLFSVPIEENHLLPLLMMRGTFAQVSTLLRFVGFPQRPFSTVWICLFLGSPTLPSIEEINAVDSPQTKAPPPLAISTSKSKPEPKIFLPNKPAFLACVMAISAFLQARGYSCLT